MTIDDFLQGKIVIHFGDEAQKAKSKFAQLLEQRGILWSDKQLVRDNSYLLACDNFIYTDGLLHNANKSHGTVIPYSEFIELEQPELIKPKLQLPLFD